MAGIALKLQSTKSRLITHSTVVTLPFYSEQNSELFSFILRLLTHRNQTFKSQEWLGNIQRLAVSIWSAEVSSKVQTTWGRGMSWDHEDARTFLSNQHWVSYV